jgi:hypothetical protein
MLGEAAIKWRTAAARWVLLAPVLRSGVAFLDATVIADRFSHDRLS